MRSQFKVLCIFLTSLLHMTIVVQANEVLTKEDALSIAKEQFMGQDVDYYILEDDKSDVWTIFIDAEPMKGWHHDCYTVSIPKRNNRENLLTHSPLKVSCGYPPDGNFVPMETTNRYGDAAHIKPIVKKGVITDNQKNIAERTYAVIINGGVEKLVNRERYWNDCSFIYQTLVNRYGVPKSHIYPLMSDGNDPADDMIKADLSSYCSQSLDLDFDGIDEIEYSATKENIMAVFNRLESILKKDDHLFLFVMDHGGCDKLTNNITNQTTYHNAYICLWGDSKKAENRLYNYELKELLAPFSARYVNINVVLGQCHSGGFIESLDSLNCVVSTSCRKEESSYACSDVPYDEFVYHWTSAINCATPNGTIVLADLDNNGHVTMEEAFEYAKKHDNKRETPQYSSTPISIGEDLAFSNNPESIDLYIKDCNLDTGKEPNTVTPMFWISPSIWTRNKNDSIHIQENPTITDKSHTAYVYVKINNRGKGDFDGTGKWMHLYWAYASAGLSTETWKGIESYMGQPTGGHYGSRQIPPIKSGSDGIVMFEWPIPSFLGTEIGSPDNTHHFCFFAKIMNQPEDDGYIPGQTYFEQWKSNDQAQRNISIIDNSNRNLYTNIFFRNIYTTDHTFSLELVPLTLDNETFFQNGFVEMSLPNDTKLDFENSTGIRVLDSSSWLLPSDNKRVAMTVPDNRIYGIALKNNDIKKIGLKFNYTKLSATARIPYTFNLIQRNEKGLIIGGETFVVNPPDSASSKLYLTSSDTQDGRTILNAEMDNLESVVWYNGDKQLGNSTSLAIPITYSDREITAIASNIDGEYATESITVQAKTGIKRIYPCQSGASVELYGLIPDNASIMAVSLKDGLVKAKKGLSQGQNHINIDFYWVDDVYAINYVINGEIIESTKIIFEP